MKTLLFTLLLTNCIVTFAQTKPTEADVALKGGSFEWGHNYAFELTYGQLGRYLQSHFGENFKPSEIPVDSINLSSSYHSLRFFLTFVPPGLVIDGSYFRTLTFSIVQDFQAYNVSCLLSVNADLNLIEVNKCQVAEGISIATLNPDQWFTSRLTDVTAVISK